MDKLSLYTQINTLPTHMKEEVKEFVSYLLSKNQQQKKSKPQRGLGVLKGKIHLSEDFDAPLDDFKDYM